MEIRLPRPDEAAALTALCLRSKAVHGYDAAFMEACTSELTVDLAAETSMAVAALDGKPVGFVEISVAGPEAELEKLFVEPSHMGRGVGRTLFDWARSEAVRAGACCLMIDSDPGAAAFYAAMGAVAAGFASSGSIPGRVLPRFCLDLDRH